jgi:hypothetical protein
MAQPSMSLFGPSVYDIQKEQALQDENAAIRQAALSPYQSIRADVSAMGSRLGRNIAGLFGVEDPRLKEASAMQELKTAINTQWDGTDPVEAYKIMAKEAARLGLTQQALAAATQVKQAEEAKAKAEIGKIKTTYEIGKLAAETQKAMRQATEAMQSKAPVVQLQKARQDLRDALQNATTELEKEEIRQQITEIDSAINLATTRAPKEEKPESFGVDREAISKEMYGKRFGDLTQQEQQTVNKRVATESRANQPSINVTLPKNLQDIGQVRQKYLGTIDPYVKAYNSASTSEIMFDQALAGNFQGWRAAITQLAKSVGDSQISAREIDAYGLDPSLVGNIVDKANTLLTGTPSRDTILGAKKIATAIKNINQQRARKEQEVYLDLATKAEGYSPEARRYFDLPMLAPGTDTGTNQKTTSRGTRYTVE